MGHDPASLVTFEADGEKFTAVIGFAAERAIEAHYDLPFFRAIQSVMPAISPEDMKDKGKIAEASADIRLTEVGRLFGFSLLKFHRDLTDDDIDDLIDDIGGIAKASEIVGKALTAAMTKGDDDSSTPNPPRGSRRKRTG